MLLDKTLASPLHILLEEKGFSFSEIPYAYWKASRSGGHITFYHSGKVLIQGPKTSQEQIQSLIQGYLKQSTTFSQSILGLDESGKGDFFGPLVLAGAIVPTSLEPELQSAGICDSKKLNDDQIYRHFQFLKQKVQWKVLILPPQEYNPLYDKWGNLNLLMIDQYKQLIHSFDASLYDKIILDRFSASEQQNRDISRSVSRDISIVPRAEQYPAVAAASIIARHHFVEWINSQATEIPKGSGPVARKLFISLRDGNKPEMFKSLAKMHFLSK